MTPRVDAQDFILPGPEQDGGLTLTFTRYRSSAHAWTSESAPQLPQLTLVVLHCVASHKEAWAPTIEHLFQLQDASPNSGFTILDVWAMDSPNHGRAGVLNASLLGKRPEGISGAAWARALTVLLRSGLLSTPWVVGIGHSAGACVIIQSMIGYDAHRLPFSSIILVEPTMMTREIYEQALKRDTVLLRAIEVAKTRKDIWPSRQAAREWLAKRIPWRRWDPRVLDLYLEYSFSDLPTVTYPDHTTGVTLSTTRTQEASGYVGFEDGFIGLERLRELCPLIPVHAIFVSKNDMVPEETQKAIVSEKEGRRMKSITRVDNSGHLVVQENPRGLAAAIWNVLCLDYPLLTSKL